MTGTQKTAALVGFVVMGASPSFIDWMQEPGKRKQIILFYGLGLTLVYYGLLSG